MQEKKRAAASRKRGGRGISHPNAGRRVTPSRKAIMRSVEENEKGRPLALGGPGLISSAREVNPSRDHSARLLREERGQQPTALFSCSPADAVRCSNGMSAPLTRLSLLHPERQSSLDTTCLVSVCEIAGDKHLEGVN